MDRRLPVALLILLPVLAIAQPGSFSLPGVGDLQKQLTETSDKKSDGTDNPWSVSWMPWKPTRKTWLTPTAT